MRKLFTVGLASKIGLYALASLATAAVAHITGANSVQVIYASATSTAKSTTVDTPLVQQERAQLSNKNTENSYGITTTTAEKTQGTELTITTVAAGAPHHALQNTTMGGKTNQNTPKMPTPLTQSNSSASATNRTIASSETGASTAPAHLGPLGAASTGASTSITPTTVAQITATSTSTTVPVTTSTAIPAQQFGSIGFQSFPSYAVTTDGVDLNPWFVQFNGYGSVSSIMDPVLGPSLNLSPAIASVTSVTHSALVTTSNNYGNFNSIFTYRTLKQLRTGSPPNSWEVGWVLFHYSDNTHFYYFLAKPTGWELGKEDPRYPGNQRFMATGSNPKFPVGATYKVSVSMLGSYINVSVNGVHVVSYTDKERPYLSGSFGVYAEDSSVDYAPIVVTQ